MRNAWWIFLGFIFVLMLFPLSLYAQTVSAVKGQKVLLDLGDMNVTSGDRIFTLDTENKRRALIQVRQVKNGKAVAEIIKGTPQVGHALALSKKAPTSRSNENESDPYSENNDSSSNTVHGIKATPGYGFTVSLLMNTMKISGFDPAGTTFPGTYGFSMTGTNFGVGGFYDFMMTRDWFVRGHGTFEMFDVKKSHSLAICDDVTSTDCNAKFMQLGGYGTMNYIFSPAPFRAWAGAGGGVLLYASKSSTVLDTNKFFFNTVLMAAGGFDYFIGRTTFIPVAFEYQMIPDKEAGVTSLVIRAGWGKTF